MASLHFIVEAMAQNGAEAESKPKRLSLHVEVEGSAPIKSRTELVRASRAIAAEAIGRAVGSEALGDFAVTETKAFDKKGEPLRSPDWPGTYVWRVAADESAPQ
jgi:hypothetical protein